MKRNKHSLSHYRLLTSEMGTLTPIGAYEVLPGDTVQQATSMLVRLSPLMAPVMHPVTVRVHHWFVPYRLLWEGWESFITGGEDGQGDGWGTPPTVSTGESGLPVGSVGDYLGIPTGVANLTVSAFPIYAYGLIWKEFYRDQDLQQAEDLQGMGPGSPCLRVAWEKDYFTSARPWPQKGPEVSLPIGTYAPVVSDPADSVPTFFTDNGSSPLQTRTGDDKAFWNIAKGANASVSWDHTGLRTDLSSATAVNVNDLRRAFAIQRYQEARAQYGSRYTEYLAYLGIRSSDARLQRPEYLGGGKQTISFSEVLQTGPDSEGNGVAELYGHGISAMRSRRYRRFFEEHGIVLSLMSVRPRAIYTNGLHRMFSRETKEDYYQRELEQIGQQEVYAREVYAANNANGGAQVFGYQDRYSEYKHHPSTVHGDFRTTLNYWHLAREFTQAPALNWSFIECSPSKRIFAEQTTNPLWIMVSHSIQARRMVRRSAASRVL